MEKQGVRGPKPRFLTGNILDMASLVSKATAQDMETISHDIVDRLLPHYVAWSTQYGNKAIFDPSHDNISFLNLISPFLIKRLRV